MKGSIIGVVKADITRSLHYSAHEVGFQYLFDECIFIYIYVYTLLFGV